MNSDEIKSFYDDFLESRMLDYRIHGNLRIDRAAERVLEFVCPDSHVLDIGCGIGIVSERIAGSLKDGHVWGTDISDQNIWYARETVGQSHASFFTADITSNPEQVRSRVKVPLDVISLIDVIEHIPKGEHSDLFQFLQSLVGSRAFVVLTYPSPQYQRHLMAQNPEELQIIDQVIEREELLSVAETAGFFLRHYSLEDVWKQNQYVHCVLQSDPSLASPQGSSPNSGSLFYRRLQSARTRIENRWDRYVRIPYRKWRYVDRVFESSSENE